MENDYLKKLNALVQAEEQKNGKRRQIMTIGGINDGNR